MNSHKRDVASFSRDLTLLCRSVTNDNFLFCRWRTLKAELLLLSAIFTEIYFSRLLSNKMFMNPRFQGNVERICVHLILSYYSDILLRTILFRTVTVTAICNISLRVQQWNCYPNIFFKIRLVSLSMVPKDFFCNTFCVVKRVLFESKLSFSRTFLDLSKIP